MFLITTNVKEDKSIQSMLILIFGFKLIVSDLFLLKGTDEIP